jgi:shikimate dehydrogenase
VSTSPTPTPATRLIALLGDPVSHSLSPAFQNAAFREAGVDGVYLALRCDAAEVPGLLRGIARAGGGGNVTIPHKGVAARAVERRTDAVARTDACNTYWSEKGEVWGDNTDVAGVTESVRSLLGGPPRGARALVIGAGGAARATVAALAAGGAGEVVVVNRTPERSRSLVERFEDAPVRGARWEELTGEAFDLAVNATSLGLHPSDPLPADPSTLRAAAALDLVYAPGGTRWLHALQAAGVPAIDGIEMLIHQGVASFRRWWGVEPSVDAMRAALDRPVSPRP